MNRPVWGASLVICLTFPLPGIATPTSEDPTSVIEGVLSSEAPVTPPQSAIGAVIEDICPQGVITSTDFQARCDELVDGVLGVVSGEGSGTDLEGARDGLQAMAPEEAAVVGTTQVDAASAQIDNIGARIANVRSGATGATAYAAPRGGLLHGAAGDPARSPWGLFATGIYSRADRDATLRESGFEADDVGVTAGIDYNFADEVLLGVAFGYRNSDADIDRNGGTLDTDSYSAFLYWSLYPDEFWFVDAMFGYTQNDHDQQRTVAYQIFAANGAGGGVAQNVTVNQRALSETESDELSGSLTVGRNVYLGNWTLAPRARVDYADTGIDGYAERMSNPGAAGSGLGLAVDSQDFESLMTTLGATLGTQAETAFGTLYPQVLAEYVHEFKNSGEPLTGRFLADPTRRTFHLLRDGPDRNFFNVGASLTAAFSDTASGYVRYQGLFGYEDLSIHGVEVGVRIAF